MLPAILLLCALSIASQAPPQTFYAALLFKGPSYTPGRSAEVEQLQQHHLEYLNKLSKAGQLVISGPIGDDGDLRGVAILRAGSASEASALTADDPAVKAGRLRAEILPITVSNWFSFAAIKEDAPVRHFALGFLTAGASRRASPDEAKEILDYWATLRDSGALMLMAPIFEPETQPRGLLIVLAVNSLDKGRALLEADPLVKGGRWRVLELPLLVRGRRHPDKRS